MENKVIKNMEYWKKKNNIPGIDTAGEAGLTGDGKAGSAPFQMKDSPNKFLGNLVQNVGQGLIGKGNMGFLNPAMWAARGAKNLLDKDPTTGTVFSGGVGSAIANAQQQQAAAGLAQGQQPQMMQPNVQVDPMAQGITMKSPMKQENEERLVSGQYLTPGEEPDTYIDEQEGEGYTDPDGFIEIDEEGLVVDNTYIVNEENVIIGVQDNEPKVPQGPMGPGGMGMMGGVGPEQVR